MLRMSYIPAEEVMNSVKATVVPSRVNNQLMLALAIGKSGMEEETISPWQMWWKPAGYSVVQRLNVTLQPHPP